jgi:hypothetical protein
MVNYLKPLDEYLMPEFVRKISKYYHQSPYSYSYYFKDGQIRVSDHWNFKDKNIVHCPTNIVVSNNHFAIGIWDGKKYLIKKIFEVDFEKAKYELLMDYRKCLRRYRARRTLLAIKEEFVSNWLNLKLIEKEEKEHLTTLEIGKFIGQKNILIDFVKNKRVFEKYQPYYIKDNLLFIYSFKQYICWTSL